MLDLDLRSLERAHHQSRSLGIAFWKLADDVATSLPADLPRRIEPLLVGLESTGSTLADLVGLLDPEGHPRAPGNVRLDGQFPVRRRNAGAHEGHETEDDFQAFFHACVDAAFDLQRAREVLASMADATPSLGPEDLAPRRDLQDGCFALAKELVGLASGLEELSDQFAEEHGRLERHAVRDILVITESLHQLCDELLRLRRAGQLLLVRAAYAAQRTEA